MALTHDHVRSDERDVRADRDLQGRDHALGLDAPGAAAPERVVVRKNSFGHTVRTVLATVILVAIVAFVALNTQSVDVELGFDTLETSVAAALGATAIAGMLVGWLFGHRRCGRPHSD